TAGVQVTIAIAAPDYHFSARPHCRMGTAASRCVRRTRRCPGIYVRIISSPSIEVVAAIIPAPYNHLAPSPYRGVIGSRARCFGVAPSRPTVCAWIVSPAAVQDEIKVVLPTPDDHLTASPHCRVKGSTNGRAIGGCPTIINASARSFRYFWERI